MFFFETPFRSRTPIGPCLPPDGLYHRLRHGPLRSFRVVPTALTVAHRVGWKSELLGLGRTRRARFHPVACYSTASSFQGGARRWCLRWNTGLSLGVSEDSSDGSP